MNNMERVSSNEKLRIASHGKKTKPLFMDWIFLTDRILLSKLFVVNNMFLLVTDRLNVLVIMLSSGQLTSYKIYKLQRGK